MSRWLGNKKVANVETWCCGEVPISGGSTVPHGRHGGLMVSALDSGSSGPGSSPGRGH